MFKNICVNFIVHVWGWENKREGEKGKDETQREYVLTKFIHIDQCYNLPGHLWPSNPTSLLYKGGSKLQSAVWSSYIFYSLGFINFGEISATMRVGMGKEEWAKPTGEPKIITSEWPLQFSINPCLFLLTLPVLNILVSSYSLNSKLI